MSTKVSFFILFILASAGFFLYKASTQGIALDFGQKVGVILAGVVIPIMLISDLTKRH